MYVGGSEIQNRFLISYIYNSIIVLVYRKFIFVHWDLHMCRIMILQGNSKLYVQTFKGCRKHKNKTE